MWPQETSSRTTGGDLIFSRDDWRWQNAQDHRTDPSWERRVHVPSTGGSLRVEADYCTRMIHEKAEELARGTGVVSFPWSERVLAINSPRDDLDLTF